MKYTIRKVRNQDKFVLKIKNDDNEIIQTFKCESRDKAERKMRESIHEEIKKEKEPDHPPTRTPSPISTDTIADDTFEDTLALSGEPDTEIEDV